MGLCRLPLLESRQWASVGLLTIPSREVANHKIQCTIKVHRGGLVCKPTEAQRHVGADQVTGLEWGHFPVPEVPELPRRPFKVVSKSSPGQVDSKAERT